MINLYERKAVLFHTNFVDFATVDLFCEHLFTDVIPSDSDGFESFWGLTVSLVNSDKKIVQDHSNFNDKWQGSQFDQLG